jgi:hypothetical protein
VDTAQIILLAVLVIVAIAAVAFLATRQRDSRRLRERFGPEYERAVEHAHNRAEAEKDLRERQERVDALDIRALQPAQRDSYAERWREVQAMFVDDPGNAVDQADRLIGEVMRARGYPVGDFDQRAADISVNHPQVVDHYRTAHSIAVKRRSGESATEQLRQAFVHYRALFADLLETTDRKGAQALLEADEPVAERVAEAEPRPTAQADASVQADRSTRASTAAIETQEPADPARRTR